MIDKAKNRMIDFIFECEYCSESWSENLLDIVDQCNEDELLKLFKYIQKKLKKKNF
ncbi:MAG: hypothetical protein ACFFEY_03225 [Candidatus Thorarchaeota archaeon]